MSKIAKSGIERLNASNADCPSVYVSTSKPSVSKVIDTEVKMLRSSSTKAIFDIKSLSH